MHELIIPAGVKRELVFVHTSPEEKVRVVTLAGEGAEVHVDEIFLSGTVRSLVKVVHAAPRTVSRVRTRGVVRVNEQVCAHATIVMPKGASQSESSVVQKFLLLGDSAKAEAIPSMEIEANDVRATHATSICPLSDDQLFYLMSRGLSMDEARDVIIGGFLGVPGGFEHVATRKSL